MTAEIAFIIMIPGFVILIAILLRAWSERTRAKWPCRIQWHHYANLNDSPIMFDGASRVRVCRRCGKHLLQDSQGNWWATGDDQ